MNDDTTIKTILNTPIQFGLRAQGKYELVEDMVAEGKSWKEIGKAIGWDAVALRRHWLAEAIDPNKPDWKKVAAMYRKSLERCKHTLAFIVKDKAVGGLGLNRPDIWPTYADVCDTLDTMV